MEAPGTNRRLFVIVAVQRTGSTWLVGKSWSRAIERKGPCLYVCTDGSRRACGVGDCPRPVPTLGVSRETAGPRIDRIPSTRPPWRDGQYRELKKLFFSPSSKCPIALFGPLANGTILKRLHVAFGLHASVLHAASCQKLRISLWQREAARIGAPTFFCNRLLDSDVSIDDGCFNR